MDLREQSLYDRIVENAHRTPHQPAFICEKDSWTWENFRLKVDLLALGLEQQGLEKGDRVAVLMDNCLEYPLLYGASVRSGWILVALNTRTSEEEILKFLKTVEPKALVFQDKYSNLVGHLQDLPSLKTTFAVDSTSVPSIPLDDCLSTNLEHLSSPEAQINEGVVIIPTAAVDGVAKGALLSQANLLTSAAMAMAEYGKPQLQTYLANLPLFHVLGLTGMWSTIVAGGTVVILPQFEPTAVVEAVDQHHVTYLASFPPILEKILDAAKEHQTRLPSLKMVHGLEFPPMVKRLQTETHAQFWVGFGQTETSCFITAAPFDLCPGSAGKPSAFNAIRIVDEQDQMLPNGKEGEIVVRGENVFLQYWGMEDATRYAQRNGWHHTGDIGKMDDQGFLWYVKPKPDKELIKTGGENVYPVEVQSVLMEHPAIEQCVVFGVPDPTWGQSVKAVCQLVEGKSANAKEISEFVGSRIAGFKKPRLVEFVKELALNGTEMDREAVKKKYGG